jgi:hypothetical protein
MRGGCLGRWTSTACRCSRRWARSLCFELDPGIAATVSVGPAYLPEGVDSPSAGLAAGALYRAKAAGGIRLADT